MRPHLKTCLLDGQMRHFPCKKRSIKNQTRKAEKLEVLCNCRPPEYGNMFSCVECGEEWYHQSCISVDSILWDNNSGIDLLGKCSN